MFGGPVVPVHVILFGKPNSVCVCTCMCANVWMVCVYTCVFRYDMWCMHAHYIHVHVAEQHNCTARK